MGFNGTPGLVNTEPFNIVLSYDGGSFSKNIKSVDDNTSKENIIEIDDGEVFSYNGKNYALFENGISWEEAQNYCESIGGHLVTINDKEEQDFVSDILSTASKKYYWLGGTKDENGNWNWVTGEDFDYTNWEWSEPNNSGGNENAIHLYRSNKKWNDLISTGGSYGVNNFGYICEWENEEIQVVAGTPFDYALFAGNNNKDLSLYTNNTTINGNVHSNSGFYFQGNKLKIDGICETVNSINAFTSSDSSSKITYKQENISSIDMLDITSKIKEKFSQISDDVVYFGQDKIDIENNIGSNKSIFFNGTTFNGTGFVFAKENITYNVNSLNANTKGQIFLCAEDGNIDFHGSDIKINGIIYAPNGTITVNANSFELNGRIICDSFVFNGTTLKINAQENDLDFISDILQKEDVPPIAKFEIEDKEIIRDTKNNTTASVKITDKSYSPDSDDISKRQWTVYYDKNNDGVYEESEVVFESDENLTEINFETENVGKYRVYLEVAEDTQNNYSASYENNFEVKNVKPEANINIKKAKNVDLVVGLGDLEYSEAEEYENAISKMTEDLADMGIHVSYDSILSSISAQDSFAWEEYDHYNYVDRYAKDLDKHITFNNNDVIMTGYGHYGFKDFLYINDNQPTEKNFSFTMKKDLTDWHSIDGAGFLLNTNITTPTEVLSDTSLSQSEKQDKSILNGYCLLFKKKVVYLIKLTDLNLGEFRNTQKTKEEEANFFGEVIQSSNFNVTNDHRIVISVKPTAISVWDNDKLIIDNCELEYMGGYGYGPIISNGYHTCDQLSYFTFKDIKMNSVTGKSLKDALAEKEWKQDSLRYAVEISNSENSDVAVKSEAIEIASQILQKDATFIGLGNDTNKALYEDFISLGGFSGFYSENENVDLSVKMLEAKILFDVFLKNYNVEQYLAAGTEVDYSESYSDFENDPIYEQEWAYSHTPDVFESNSGYIENNLKNISEPIKIFSKTGNYSVATRFRDNPVQDNNNLDEYRLWSDVITSESAITVHSKPIADAQIELYTTADGKCAVRFIDKSYDPDHISLPNKGIMSYEYKYKKLNDTEWTKGKIPSILETGEQYFVSIKVTDLEGEESEPFIKLINAVGDTSADIDVEPPVITLESDKTEVFANENFKITTFAEDNDGVDKFALYVNNELVSEKGGEFEITANSKGQQVVTCIAEDGYGNVAQKSLVVNVKEQITYSEDEEEKLFIKVWTDKDTYEVGESVKIIMDSNQKELINRFDWYHNDTYIGEGMDATTKIRLVSGINEIKLVVTNIYGETAEDTATCTFEITDKELPYPQIVTPTHEELLKGTTEFTGYITTTFEGQEIAKYSLEYKPYPNTNDTEVLLNERNSDDGYKVIAEGSGSFETKKIADWDTTAVSDGRYYVRLVATDNYGLKQAHNISCYVLNNETGSSAVPTEKEEMALTLTVSRSEAEIGDTIDVKHIVNNFNDVRSSYLYINDDEVSKILGTTTLKVNNAGWYNIKFVVEDINGNKYEAVSKVIVNGKDFVYTDEVGIKLSKSIAKVNEDVELSVTNDNNKNIKVLVDNVEKNLENNKLVFTSEKEGSLSVSVFIDGEEVKLNCMFYEGELQAPEVELNLGELDEIYAPTEIKGTVKANKYALDSYILNYRLSGSNEWTSFAVGTEEVNDDVLGTFDPTLLENGLYEIQLYAENEYGVYTTVSAPVIVSGAMKPGVFNIGFTDMNSNIGGVNLSANRFYSTARANTKGDFGYGWDLGLNDAKIYVTKSLAHDVVNFDSGFKIATDNSSLIPQYTIYETEPHYIVVCYGNGRVEKFRLKLFEGSAVQGFKRQEVVSFEIESAPGNKGKLAFAKGCNFNTQIAGENVGFLNGDSTPIDADSFILTTEDNSKAYLDTKNGLTKLINSKDEAISITSKGYFTENGKGISFTRNSDGFISKLTDANGNVFEYTYENGDLVKTVENDTITINYTYDDAHRLIEMSNSNGQAVAHQNYDENGRLVSSVDGKGNTITYDHNINDRQEVVTNRRGITSVYTYDDMGNIKSERIKTPEKDYVKYYTYDEYGNKLTETDENGNTTTYEYDENYNISSITNALNQKQYYTYDSQNRVTGVKDANGILASISYDDYGNITDTKADSGYDVSYTYENKQLTGISDSIGKIVQYTNDDSGNPITITDAEGNVTHFTYDAKGNCTSKYGYVTGSTGDKVLVTYKYEYDSANRLKATTDVNNNRTITTEYDENGNVAKTTDSDGLITTYGYDKNGNNTSILYPDGRTENFAYDEENNLISSISVTGKVTKYDYDELNRLITKTYANGGAESYEYDGVGNVTKHTAVNGAVTKYVYDALGRNTQIADALGNNCYYTYTDKGLIESYKDFNGNTYNYEYDLNGNCTKITLPDETSISYEYDLRGRNISQTNQLGEKTVFAYDGLDRLVSVTDANENVWKYTYNESGNITSVTDPKGNTTAYGYDEYGRLVKTTLPLEMYSTNEYNVKGELISYTDFNSKKATYSYDKYGKKTSVKYADSSKSDYVYDDFGRLIKVTFTDGESTQVTEYSYNSVDGLEKVTNSDGTYVKYDYFADGSLKSVETNFGTTQYTYDKLGRLATVTDENGTTTYGYDNNGNLTKSVNPANVITIYTYDSCNCLTNEKVTDKDNIIIAEYKYTLDKLGRRIKVEESGITNRTVEYTYDNLDRLTSEKVTENGETTTVTYTFDKANNRIEKNDNGKITKYTYDNNNRLLTEGDKTYGYDKNGNTIFITENGKTITYTYFDFGKVKSIEDDATKETYTYDYQGRRVAKEITTKATQTTEKINYLLDDNGLVYNVLAEYDKNLNATTTYTYGNSLISITTTGKTSYYLTDGSGSTRALTNELGKVTDTYIYDAFGNLTNQTGSTYNPYLYNQEQYDQNTGLYYLRARYLNPATGRFITQDSYGGNTYDPASLHRYNYANGNPVIGTDPTGYNTYTELLTSISIQGTFVRSLTFGVINTGRIVVAKLLTNQSITPMDVIENFAKGQIGYFFVESMFWETLPMINYGSGMFSGTKLGDKVNRVSGDLLNKYYSTPASTSVEIISRNNKNITSKIDLDGSDSTEYVDLTGFRRTHILNNHKYGIGKPNKTEFPKNWSDDKIIHYVSDVDTDPNATWGVGKWNSPYAIGIREGVEIRVDFYPDVHKNYSGMISTAYPLNTPTNPPKGGVFNGN